MLQIASGKFYNSIDDDEPKKGIVYANFNYPQPIETNIFTIHPIEFMGVVNPYLITFNQKYERGKGELEARMRPVWDSYIIDQIVLFLSFCLKSFFHVEKSYVVSQCRNYHLNEVDRYIPSRIVSNFFDVKIGKGNNNIPFLQEFVKKSVSLPRKDYINLINVLRTFYNSIQIVDKNFDLAYTMLVYILDSLTQKYDKYEPVWEDYNEKNRHSWEQLFCDMKSKDIEQIKNIIIKDHHFKLSSRFQNFCKVNITSEFFTYNDVESNMLLQNYQLSEVIKNAYKSRSNYVHKLEELVKELKNQFSPINEIYKLDSSVYLTYNGLANITHFIIKNHFLSIDSDKHEKYDWKKDDPNISTLPMAPQTWIHLHENFQPNHAYGKLNGFFELLESNL